MNNFIKCEKNGLIVLFFCLTMIIAAYFGAYVILDLPLLYLGDLKTQWFFFYEEFSELIQNLFTQGELPFYSWDMYLGTNFYASKSYYVLGDIFNYFGLLFNVEFFDMAMILEILKFYVSALGMYLLLSKQNIKTPTKVIGALAYTFSGWAISLSEQMSFLSFYAWLPYYFMAMENYLQHKKTLLYVMFTFILLFTNYYLFFTISCLSPIYFLYRYYCIHHTMQGWVKASLKLIGYYFVGVMITMITTLPSIAYILANERVASYNAGMNFPIEVYLHYLVSSFVPNYLYVHSGSVFETGHHFSREVCLYGGALISLLVPQFLASKDKHYKKATTILYGLFAIMLVVPFFSSILHGFSDPSLRWVMFIVLINILVVSKVLDEIENLDIKLLNKSFTTIITLLIVVVPFTAIAVKKASIMNYIDHVFLCVIFIVVYLVYWGVLKNKTKRTLSVLIIILTLELLLSGAVLYSGKLEESKIENKEYIHRVTHVLQSNDYDLNNYLNTLKDGEGFSQYYRVYVPYEELYWGFSYNMSIMYQLNGLMSYDSTYAPSLAKLKEITPQVNDFNLDWIFKIEDAELLNFLNTKYAIMTGDDSLPEGVSWKLVDDDYYYGLSIYENEDYRPLGTTYSQVKIYDEFGGAAELLDYVVCEEEDYQEIASLVGNDEAYLMDVNYSNNNLFGWIESSDDSFMILTLPYDSGWNIIVGGQEVEVYNVNGGFMGFKVPKGGAQLEMYFTPQGFQLGLIISGCGVLIFMILVLQQHFVKKKRNK